LWLASSGGLLEKGLMRVLRDVPVGSLLVQSDASSGEPLLLHVMLPDCIRDRSRAESAWVFLLDAQVCCVRPHPAGAR
jgi:uridine kinase